MNDIEKQALKQLIKEAIKEAIQEISASKNNEMGTQDSSPWKPSAWWNMFK